MLKGCGLQGLIKLKLVTHRSDIGSRKPAPNSNASSLYRLHSSFGAFG